MEELSKYINMLMIIRTKFLIIGKEMCKHGVVEGENKLWNWCVLLV